MPTAAGATGNQHPVSPAGCIKQNVIIAIPNAIDVVNGASKTDVSTIQRLSRNLATPLMSQVPANHAL